MTGVDHDKGPRSNEPEGESRVTPGSRWTRFKELILLRPKKIMENNEDEQPLRNIDEACESGGALKSFRTFKKTKTFAGMFGKGGRVATLVVQGSREPEEGPSQHPLCEAKGSSNSKSRTLSLEGKQSSTPTSGGYRHLEESTGNLTMIFKGDFPPSSPLSTATPAVGDGEKWTSRKNYDEHNTQRSWKQVTLNRGACNNEAEGSNMADTASSMTEKTNAKPKSGARSFFNLRLGSMALDDEFMASRTQNSPQTDPARLHKRTSSLPGVIGHPAPRSAVTSSSQSDVTKKRSSNDYESPWGIRDKNVPEDEEKSKTSSKTFRVAEFVSGLKGWRPTHDSSNSFSLSDENRRDAPSCDQAVDMLEDEFVDYSVKQLLKTNRRKSSRSKKWKA